MFPKWGQIDHIFVTTISQKLYSRAFQKFPNSILSQVWPHCILELKQGIDLYCRANCANRKNKTKGFFFPFLESMTFISASNNQCDELETSKL